MDIEARPVHRRRTCTKWDEMNLNINIYNAVNQHFEHRLNNTSSFNHDHQ